MGKNKISTMVDLEKEFHKAKQFGMNYIAVKLRVPESKDTNLNIIPKSNFDTQLKYYKETYDENLKLKSNPEVKIIAACSAYKVSTIIDTFMWR